MYTLPTWARLGVEVEDAMDSSQALTAAGADFEVWLSPISADVNRTDEDGEKMIFSSPIPNYFATMRSHPVVPKEVYTLGVVGSRYTLIQNSTTFEFCDDLMEVAVGDPFVEGFNFYRCAALDMGRVLFTIMKAPAHIQVAEQDEVDIYVCLSTSHDGTRSFTCQVLPVKRNGQTTLNMVVPGAYREWAVRHTLNVHSRLNGAKHSLGLITNYLQLFEQRANAMGEKRISDKQFDNICKKMYPDSDSKIGQSKAENARAAVMQIFKENQAVSRNNAWGAYNAFAIYFDHVREWGDNGATRRAEGALFGRTMSLKDKALSLIMKEK